MIISDISTVWKWISNESAEKKTSFSPFFSWWQDGFCSSNWSFLEEMAYLGGVTQHRKIFSENCAILKYAYIMSTNWRDQF